MSYELYCQNRITRAESSVLETSKRRAQPGHALSELQLSFAITAVNETAVALDTIMCGDDVTDRTAKVHVCFMRDQLSDIASQESCEQNRDRCDHSKKKKKKTWFKRHMPSQRTWIKNGTTLFRNCRV